MILVKIVFLINFLIVFNSFIASRSLASESVFGFVRRKLNKLIKGSETPYVYKDYVKEQILKERWWFRGIGFGNHDMANAKAIYLRDKARARIVRHNDRIRKLEDKITKSGVVGIKGYSNKF